MAEVVPAVSPDPGGVLVVQHEDDCPPAWVGEWLAAEGVRLDVRRPYAGDRLPAGLDEHDGLLVLGGSMGAHDDGAHEWLTPTKDLVRRAVTAGVPTLGICLGHQLAAVALGGTSARNVQGQQVGLLPVGWSEAADSDPLVGPVAGAARGVHWNSDVVTALPEGTVVLARAPGGEVQAARFAPVCWGVQWHPEIGVEILRHWAKEDEDRHLEQGIDQEAALCAVAEAEPELVRTWQPLAASFARLVRERRREPAAQ